MAMEHETAPEEIAAILDQHSKYAPPASDDDISRSECVHWRRRRENGARIAQLSHESGYCKAAVRNHIHGRCRHGRGQ